MMLKVFDLLRSLGWYIVSFIYNLISYNKNDFLKRY